MKDIKAENFKKDYMYRQAKEAQKKEQMQKRSKRSVHRTQTSNTVEDAEMMYYNCEGF